MYNIMQRSSLAMQDRGQWGGPCVICHDVLCHVMCHGDTGDMLCHVSLTCVKCCVVSRWHMLHVVLCVADTCYVSLTCVTCFVSLTQVTCCVVCGWHMLRVVLCVIDKGNMLCRVMLSPHDVPGSSSPGAARRAGSCRRCLTWPVASSPRSRVFHPPRRAQTGEWTWPSPAAHDDGPAAPGSSGTCTTQAGVT